MMHARPAPRTANPTTPPTGLLLRSPPASPAAATSPPARTRRTGPQPAPPPSPPRRPPARAQPARRHGECERREARRREPGRSTQVVVQVHGAPVGGGPLDEQPAQADRAQQKGQHTGPE